MTTALAPSNGTMAEAPKRSPLYQLANRFHIEADKLMGVLTGTVIKPTRDGRKATLEEIAAFCIVADQYGLNPFTREIHAYADRDKGVVPIVGIDGWAKIVNSEPLFDGCEFAEQAKEDGSPIAITCTMYVKGRTHPIPVTERYTECKRDTFPWKSMPWRMLRHKAYMQAARVAFSISGLYDEDEARDIIAPSASIVTGGQAKSLEEKFKPVDVQPAAPSKQQLAESGANERAHDAADAKTSAEPVKEPEDTPIGEEPADTIDVSTWELLNNWVAAFVVKNSIDPAKGAKTIQVLKLSPCGSGRSRDAKERTTVAQAMASGNWDWDLNSIIQ